MNLADLLETATDGIESPRLAAPALTAAKRRRARTLAAAGTAAASATIITVAALVSVFAGDEDASPVLNPSPTLSSAAPSSPAPTSGRSEPPGWGTQPEWDPRKVDELPSAEQGTVPGLPTVIDPPGSAEPLTAAPIEPAILAVNTPDRVAFVLSMDGQWRSVPLDGKYAGVSLSPSGTRLLILDGDNEEDPVLVQDLATGAQREIPYPDGYQGWDYSGWRWRTDDSLLLTARDGGWLVDAVSGEPSRVRYPRAFVSGIASDGAVLEASDWDQPQILTDWSVQPPQEVSIAAIGHPMHLVADDETVVASSYDGHPFSVIVADRATLTPSWVLPVLDWDGNYSPGAVRPIAIRDDGTVLLHVGVFGRDVDGFRIVEWDPMSGDLVVVSSTDIGHSVTFAEERLATDP